MINNSSSTFQLDLPLVGRIAWRSLDLTEYLLLVGLYQSANVLESTKVSSVMNQLDIAGVWIKMGGKYVEHGSKEAHPYVTKKVGCY